MAKVVDLTLARLRHPSNLDDSKFLDLYSRLMQDQPLSDIEYIDVLRFAILFMRSTDDIVSRLGYRIVLQYSEATRDYQPLHEIAQVRELVPVVAAIERIDPILGMNDSLSSVLSAAHNTNFATVEQDGSRLFRTRGQMELREFNSRTREAIVVAPTSYGKSEMLIEKIAQSLEAATCVLVPTRALISQTRALIVADPRVRAAHVRVLTHPDAYTDEDRFIAVMTQERLHRLLTDHSELRLDQLLVDEAHNLLSRDTRAVELSQVVLTARARNKNLAVTYYTPFMSEPESLRHVNDADLSVRARSVNEHVKAERIAYAPLGSSAVLYDQFLNRTIALDRTVPSDELSAVMELAEGRTLVYVNRPKDAQDLASRLAERRGRAQLSPEAQRAIQAIGDLIDPNYSLIRVIEAGLLFHHGQVPDILRQYIERLFRDDSSPDQRLLVTTSTLLEGVNTPADCLIMMTPSRGRKYLSPSAFRNLIGRVARFREVFDSSRADLDLLQPRIYLVPSSYARRDWDVGAFLARVANLARAVEDSVENPLLEEAGDSDDRQKALEYLENIEPGASHLVNPRLATTEVGRLCFQNGVRDFDIFLHEEEIQARVDAVRDAGKIFADPEQVVNAVCDLFLEGVALTESNPLERVRDTNGARRFYTMFIEWRTHNEPFKRLISRFVSYWSQLDDEFVYVGSRWGEETFGPEGVRKLYVRMKAKSRVEMINLAVAKIKEEQDFVDFQIIKYIEILHSLALIEQDFYDQIKFGTSDPYLICLLRNGFSPELARIVKEDYPEYVSADFANNTVIVMPELPDAMIAQDENDILVYEATTLVNAGLPI